jgi:hypothetical protein
LLSLGCSLFCLGCRPWRGPTTFTSGGVGWNSAEKEQSVPGIDHAVVRWYIRGEDLTYVIWTDLVGGAASGSGGTGGSSSGVERGRGHLDSSDGQRLEYEYIRDLHATGSANTGVITIGDVRYDLKHGSLLLVSTQANEIQVKQLDIDPSIVELLQDKSHTEGSMRAVFKAMANDNPGIGSFFEKVVGGEWAPDKTLNPTGNRPAS